MFTGNKQAINYHITEVCNMKCSYCFAKYGLKSKKELTREESCELIDRIAEAGARKLTFVGGEPTLCPWLSDLIAHAKMRGLTTMIVTNGTGLTDSFLNKMQGSLDWIGVSVNSLCLDTLKAIGAQCRSQRIDGDFYYELIKKIKDNGYRLKINTVVSTANKNEDFSGFINYAIPDRWKVMQVLPLMPGTQKFSPTKEEFKNFCDKHRRELSCDINLVVEDSELMTASYIMVDPLGRFCDNSTGSYTYSEPILKVGIENAFKQVLIDDEKMRLRNAVYNW